MKKLSRGTVRLLKEAILSAKSKGLVFQDRYVLCQEVCELVEQKYSGGTLDYQLKRMQLTTTKAVLDAIDTFFYTSPQFLDENTEINESDLDDLSIS